MRIKHESPSGVTKVDAGILPEARSNAQYPNDSEQPSEIAPTPRMLYHTAINPSIPRSRIAHQPDIPDECPDCGSERVVRKRSIFGIIFGWAMVMIGFLGAIPTLGVSIIVGLWGVFLMVPRLRCKSCGWNKRTT
jgi:hypothetical protein